MTLYTKLLYENNENFYSIQEDYFDIVVDFLLENFKFNSEEHLYSVMASLDEEIIEEIIFEAENPWSDAFSRAKKSADENREKYNKEKKKDDVWSDAFSRAKKRVEQNKKKKGNEGGDAFFRAVSKR